MFYTKQKTKKISLILVATLTIFIVNIGVSFASSYSSNFSVNDEALDFAHNSDYLSSSSYAMDLGTVSWVDRVAESTSYSVIDANSELSDPVTPPPPTPGGDSGSIAGGRLPESGDIDNANLVNLDSDYQYPNYLHNAADEGPSDPMHDAADELPQEVVAINTDDDTDGCSFHFERKFLTTNPLKNDTDGDGIEDCDEALIYGMIATEKDENDDYIGLAKSEEFIVTQNKPLFVGRADFGEIQVVAQRLLVQIEINKLDPITSIGMFFIEKQEDHNFAQILDFEFEDGIYESVLLFGGEMQESKDVFVVDTQIEYTSLEIDISDNGKLGYDSGYVHLTGSTGRTYGTVAIWKHTDFIDVSATVAGADGRFSLYSPKKLMEGEYEITLYSLDKRDGKIIQTNYQQINIEVQGDEVFIINDVKPKEAPRWTAALDYLHAAAGDVEYFRFKNIEYKNNFMYLVSFGVFFSISILTFLTLCRKESV